MVYIGRKEIMKIDGCFRPSAGVTMLDEAWYRRAILAVKEKLPPSRARNWETQSGKVLFKYLRARYHLEEVRSSYHEIIQEQRTMFAASPQPGPFSSVYTGVQAERLFIHLDCFFEAIRSCQDFTLDCLGSAEVMRNPPRSLHNYCKKPLSVDALNIERVLHRVWVDHGDNMRDYRDCFSHFVPLSGGVWQRAINTYWDGKEWKVALFLPDNPEAKKDTAFSYDKEIEALIHCESMFEASEDLLKAVIESCLAKYGIERVPDSGYSMTLRGVRIFGDMTFGVKRINNIHND